MENIIPVSCENKFSYNIILEYNFENLVRNIKSIKREKYDKICVFTDDNVAEQYLKEVVDRLSVEYSVVITFIMPHGEANKQLDIVEKLYECLIENRFSRKDLLVALGGGVIGDMCGFAAATYLRGIDFIQIPTTLLSQVDSSIGGKTGVDFLKYKNMIGAFYMPKLVYINLNSLRSLPDDQFSCGMGEVIKYGLIMDAGFYGWLLDHNGGIGTLSDDDIFKIVKTCVLCKKKVVEEDPKEQGVRSYLNFGHTIGHAVENLSDFSLFHGQCVAIGMVAAMYISTYHAGMSDITMKDIEKLKAVLTNFGLPYEMPSDIIRSTPEDILSVMMSDKKAVGKRIKFIILSSIGCADSYMDFSDEDYISAIREIMPKE